MKIKIQIQFKLEKKKSLTLEIFLKTNDTLKKINRIVNIIVIHYIK